MGTGREGKGEGHDVEAHATSVVGSARELYGAELLGVELLGEIGLDDKMRHQLESEGQSEGGGGNQEGTL